MHQQPDLFEETLAKKICRIEKWIVRLQKEIWFLKEVYRISQGNHLKVVEKGSEQADLFSAGGGKETSECTNF